MIREIRGSGGISPTVYLPLAGGTMVGNVIYNDNVSVLLGTGSDGNLYHDGTNTYFKNATGAIIIENDAVDGDIIFKVNDGGVDTTVMTIDGATSKVDVAGDFQVGTGGSLFTNEAVTGGFPAPASSELVIKNNIAGANVLSVRNLDNTGYSAYTSRGADGREYFAFGYGNPSATAIFADANYIQSWSGTSGAGAAKIFRITMDGDYGSIGTGFRFYQRQSFEQDGSIKFWKLIPWGTTQQQSVVIDATGQGLQYIKLFQDTNSNTVEWWKDASASKVIAIGLNKPGSGVLGDDIVFSTYDGSAWAERMRVLNSNGNIGIGETVPTAKLHLPAATAAANTASLKIPSGTVATTPVAGNIEADALHIYWTKADGTRLQLDN